MDPDRLSRQAALRARARAAINEALAGARQQAPSPRDVVAETIGAIAFACWDLSLEPADRLALIDEALLLAAALKELAAAAPEAAPALIAEVSRRAGELLGRHARARARARARG